MTTARQIITDALTFGLNRLAAGETLDADTADVCLSALNAIADEMNGGGLMLWREIASTATVSASPATLGTTWPDVPPGSKIISATRSSGGSDIPLSPLTFEQWLSIPNKETIGQTYQYAQDGYANVYLFPVPASLSVTIHVMQPVSDFADLDTEYGMPAGKRSVFAALLAEKMGPSLVGGVPAHVAKEANKARLALMSKMVPSIINTGMREGSRDLFVGG